MDQINQRPICPSNEFCGGCSLQEYKYEAQLSHKLKTAKHALEDNGIDPDILREIVPSPSIYAYRNKMEYSFGDEFIGGPLNLGMHKVRNYMAIIDAGCCQLVPEDFNTVLNASVNWCREKSYSFYHRKRHIGLLRNLVVKQGVRTGQLLVNIVTSSQSEFDEEGFKDLILGLELESEVVGILHTIDDNVADALVCEKLNVLYGEPFYMEEILGLKFKVGAFSFFQSNVSAAERLYRDAISLIDDLEGKTVYDLYCGTGTITQAMALKAKKAIGVEIVAEAVEAAKTNAKLNGLLNCEFLCGDVFEVLDSIEEKPDVIVVDPPRSGIHPKAMEKILSYGVDQIIYVSCNPKTLALNLKACSLYGYKPVSMKAYDNFAFTDHTEAICVLRKCR